MTEKTLIYSDLSVTDADVCEQMGYGTTVPDSRVLSELHAIVDEVSRFLRPRFCFFVERGTLNVEEGTLTVGATRFDLAKIIARQLHGSEAFAFFVCTAGVEYEQYQQRLKDEGDMMRVFVADALGSVIAEKCADQMELSLQLSVDKLGWQRTNRFSPGYCGWHVSQQQSLFPLFWEKERTMNTENNKADTSLAGVRLNATPVVCGVRLTDSSLMVPIKSVSGIIGLGSGVRRMDYSCGLCDLKQCYKRKQKVPYSNSQ